MIQKPGRPIGCQAAMILLLTLTGITCQSSERIAPDGSTITLAALPASIILVNGVQSSPVTILATVRNSIGVALSGQDVRFTTSSGTLNPSPGTPIATDSNGNAMTTLTTVTVNPTITATSGKVSQTLTLTASSCALATITISPSSIQIVNCTSSVPITATARDSSNNTCQGVLIKFADVASQTPSTDITFVVSPSSAVTDASGEVTTNVTPPLSDCQSKCSTGAGKTCSGAIQATDSGGNIQSTPAQILDQVP